MKKGFTLVELLVVVAILGVLAAVGIVSYGGYITSAKETVAKSNHYNLVKFFEIQLQGCASGNESMDLLGPYGTSRTWECHDPVTYENHNIGSYTARFYEHHMGFIDPGNGDIVLMHGPDCPSVVGISRYWGDAPGTVHLWTRYKKDEVCLLSKIDIQWWI